jgi:hypothetical protein
MQAFLQEQLYRDISSEMFELLPKPLNHECPTTLSTTLPDFTHNTRLFAHDRRLLTHATKHKATRMIQWFGQQLEHFA